MAGDNKRPPPSSSSNRKSRWKSPSPATPSNPSKSTAPSKRPPSNTNPTPKPNPNPNPNPKPNPNPSQAQSRVGFPPGGPPFHFQDPSLLGPPPPPPTYGFHLLDRRTIILADGSLRSYFALPPDYHDPPPPPPLPRPPLDHSLPSGPHPFGPARGSQEYWNSLGLDGRVPDGSGSGSGLGSMKRKFGDGDNNNNNNNINIIEGDEVGWRRQQLLLYGNVSDSGPSSGPFDQFRATKQMRIGENMNVVDEPHAVMKAFLKYSKLLNESANQRKNYLEMKNPKYGYLKCMACRSSKDFPDVHSLVMHAYTCDNMELRVEHLGLHRALCVLLGWSYLRPPDNSKVYQALPADEAAANQDDLILWPPTVIIHNTNTGKDKEGRIEGLGNKIMNGKMRDLGFRGGKSKSLYSREGHLGITLMKFTSDQSGLREAMRLADHFEKGHHGRKHWAQVQSASDGKDDESNPDLVVLDEITGDKTRILYGYLGTAFDLYKLDHDTRKKILIESRREILHPLK